MKLSVICPIFNEEKYIEKCIQSVIDSDFPKEDMELLLIDGNSTDRTREIISEYSSLSWIRLLDNPRKIVPCALNIGVKNARGEYVIRIDAHTSYEPNYFSTLLNWHAKLEADNIGTVCRTDVLNRTPKTLAIREVLCNKFGVGNSAFRTGITTLQEADTVPFGCWKKEIFEKCGYFDERLIRNQDIEFNKRILRNGGKIYLVPDSFCTYYARETWKALARNNFQNGVWNILTISYTGHLNSISLRHLVPLFFVLSLTLPVLLSAVLSFFVSWGKWFSLISGASLLAYTLLIFTVSLNAAVKKHLNIFYLVATFATLHIAYGTGTLLGFLKTRSNH